MDMDRPNNKYADLRRRTQVLLNSSPNNPSALPDDEIKRLVHELNTYQVELELQNEDLRQAQIELEISMHRYTDLYDFAPIGYLTISDKGIISEANLTACKLLALERERLLKSSFTQFVCHEDQNTLYKSRRKLIETHEPQTCDLRMKKQDGSPFYVQLRLVIRDKTDREAGQYRLEMTDISDRKKAEEEISNYSKTQTILLQEVNHRVKNNLTAIMSMLHQEEDRVEPKDTQEYTTRLQEVIARIQGLCDVHHLLSSTHWQPLSLSTLCTDIVTGSIKALHSNKLISLDVPPSDCIVDSDQAHYLAIILNELTINSLKYSFQKDKEIRINLSIQDQKESIQLIFHDNGPGYPESILDGHIPSSCIGHNLIQGIVRTSLQGDIELKNDAGATTIITFPKFID